MRIQIRLAASLRSPIMLLLIIAFLISGKVNPCGSDQERQWQEWLKSNPPLPGSIRLKMESSFPAEGAGADALLWDARRIFGGQGIISGVNSSENRVLQYDLRGKYLGSFGRKGQGPGEFGSIVKIIHGADGLTVYDMNGRLTRLNKNGEFIRSASIPYVLFDIAEAPGGEYYAAPQRMKSEEKLVDILDSNGKIQRTFGNTLNIRVPDGRWWKSRLDTNSKGQLYLAFEYWPVLRKYSAEGDLLFERKLDSPIIEWKEKTNRDRSAANKSGSMSAIQIIVSTQAGKDGAYLLHTGPRIEVYWVGDQGTIKSYFVERGSYEENYSSLWIDEDKGTPIFYLLMTAPDNKICIFK
jgi:hypothetical protein